MSADAAEFAGELFDQYVQERPYWEHVTSNLRLVLARSVTHLRVPAKVQARTKTIGSVIGKAYRKPDDYSSLAQFEDLAAARVVVPFADQVPDLVNEIAKADGVTILDDDPKTPEPGELSYQARHLLVELTGDLVPEDPPSAFEDRPIRSEVQLQTFAQSLWANTSHLLTYKKSLPDDVERRVLRLVALCELFDSEVVATRDQALEAADHIERISIDLNRYFTAITGQPTTTFVDPTTVVARLLPESVKDLDGYPAVLEAFVDERWERLHHVLTDRPEERGLPLLTRPEVILVFERLSNAPHGLRAAWTLHFSPAMLDDLAAIWPNNVSD